MNKNETRIVAVVFPNELHLIGVRVAKERGISFSELVRVALIKEISFNGRAEVRVGGDRSEFKSENTHARVCAKMREARALKRIREKAKLLASKQESGSQGDVA